MNRFSRSDYIMGCGGSVMDDPDNEFDSTWDDENEEHFGMMRVTKQQTCTAHRNLEAARDMQNYRRRCEHNKHANQSHGQERDFHNLHFYQNRSPSHPDGVYIEDFHTSWFGDYTKLEKKHSYIQWLFPTQEPGVNYRAHVLTPTEIRLFHRDMIVKKRLLKSYKLMLDFYGIQLVDEETGEVKRAENCRERFENLNRNTHNNLRITRILKCLGLLGFQHYQAPLVHFFLKETLVEETLPRVKQSTLDYFMFAVLDKTQRKGLIRFAFRNFHPKELFVWCPKRIQRKLLKDITQKKHPSQTLAYARREVIHHQPHYRPPWTVHSPRSQNSARNNGPRSTDPRKLLQGIPYNRAQNRGQNQNSVTKMDLVI
ncbi:opioid growth factor receptor-like [Hemibagrus wyckioides]|uniref:opioid growth factor receptor-like n=1 Tax=Hemibagrus wyckioides TaxID=337641 RepID=UPI00266C1AD0|nr:opioid growth factor receptor-like [Hemibagrus wyckioides]